MAPETSRLADELNRLVQERRIAAGELGARVGVGELRVGDQVVFGRNGMVQGAERVQNGVVGRLEGVEGSNLRISIEGRGEVKVDPRLYRDLEHGYALSLHRSQGQTAERVEVLADRLMDRHAAYVALSRHREEVRLHVPVALAAGSAADGKLLEAAAADGRLRLGEGRGIDVRALSAANRSALGRDLVEVDRRGLVSGLAERMSQARSKDLARDHRGELDYAHLVQGRAEMRAAIATAANRVQEEAKRERDAGFLAEAVSQARAEHAAKREALAGVVAKVYADPDWAMRELEARADRATARSTVRQPEAERLGELRGRERLLLGADQARRDAVARCRASRRRFDRLVEARWELGKLEARIQEFKAEQPKAALPTPHTGLAAGVSVGRAAVSIGKDLVDSPDRAALSAAMESANAVSPAAGRVAGVVVGAVQSGSAESAFVSTTTSLGKMALTRAVAMLPPVLAAPALVGIRVLGKVIDVAGPER